MTRTVRQGALRLALFGVALLTIPRAAAAQTGGTITGQVIDAASRAPLPNTQVYITGTRMGTITNQSGTYRIVGVPAGPVEVRFRLIGYAQVAKTVAVAEGRTVTLDQGLSHSAVTLNEIVTTGTGGAVEEKKLGNTVGKVDLSDLAFSPVQTPSEVLQGRIPGVSALPSGGLAGEGARIRIRGNASLTQSNEAVVYIDGVRADPGGGFGRLASGGGSPSRIDDIDPNSIERIEVLKGAAAATLYGTEASNGVIQIFTRKGVAGAPRYTMQVERSSSAYPDVLQPIAGFARTQAQADSLTRFYGFTVKPYEPFHVKPSRLLEETGNGSVMSLNGTGGSPGLTYFASGRYQAEDGPYTSSYYGGIANDIAKKYQGTLNLTLFPRDNLRMGLRTFYTASHNETPPNNNNTYAPYGIAMWSKPEMANCSAGSFPGDPTYGIASPGVCKGAGNPTGSLAFATVREATMEAIAQDASHYNGVVSASFLPAASVTLDATVGLDYTNARSSSFLPFGNAVDKFSQRDPEGQRSVDNLVTENITVDVKGSWTRDINSTLNSTFVFGGQGFINKMNQNGSFASKFAGPGLEVVSAGIDPRVSEQYVKNVNAGYFAQEQLGWHDWTFLTVGGRYDKNSAFGESAGGVFYPKVSVSLVPSDRGGWSSTILPTLRLRAAYGRSGRQPGAFDKFTTYQALPSEYGGGLVPSNLGNAELKPEVSTEWEVGAETGLFSDKLGVNLTYWNRTVNDALVAKQFPLSGGFRARQLANSGQLGAHGWEIGGNAFVVNRPNVGVNVFANGAYLWQKVVSMGGAAPIKVGGAYPRYRNFLKEGYAPGALLGAKLLQPCSSYGNPATDAKGGCLAAGQFPLDLNRDGKPDTDAELLNALRNALNPTNLIPMIADDDGNGDKLDHYLGKPYPDWSGALGGNVRLGNSWKVGTLFEFRAGNYTITDLTGAFRKSSASIGRNTPDAAALEAILLNPASTPEARVQAAKDWTSRIRTLNEPGLNQNENGNFMRWRELNLTYTVPTALAGRMSARDVAITFGVRNLKLWTAYPGTDPESNVIGRGGAGIGDASNLSNNYLDAVEMYGFPLARRFNLALRVGF